MNKNPINQRGYILITSLIFMLVLTLVAISAMDTTTMELRMSNNTVLKSRSFESSEAMRTLAGELIDVHAYNRGWPAAVAGKVENNVFNFAIPSAISILDKDSDSIPDNLFFSNESGESVFSPPITNDMSYKHDENSDGDYIDAEDLQASLAVYKSAAIAMPGSGSCQICGYEGTGKSSAAGGTVIFYELHSSGSSAGSASSVTITDYRHIVRN